MQLIHLNLFPQPGGLVLSFVRCCRCPRIVITTSQQTFPCGSKAHVLLALIFVRAKCILQFPQSNGPPCNLAICVSTLVDLSFRNYNCIISCIISTGPFGHQCHFAPCHYLPSAPMRHGTRVTKHAMHGLWMSTYGF